MFISFLYMFRATMWPSFGEITVSLRHLVFVTLFGWLSGMHTRQSSEQSDKYQVWHKYSYFSRWWAHILPKRVEKRNKHTKKKKHHAGFIYQTSQILYFAAGLFVSLAKKLPDHNDIVSPVFNITSKTMCFPGPLSPVSIQSTELPNDLVSSLR